MRRNHLMSEARITVKYDPNARPTVLRRIWNRFTPTIRARKVITYINEHVAKGCHEFVFTEYGIQYRKNVISPQGVRACSSLSEPIDGSEYIGKRLRNAGVSEIEMDGLMPDQMKFLFDRLMDRPISLLSQQFQGFSGFQIVQTKERQKLEGFGRSLGRFAASVFGGVFVALMIGMFSLKDTEIPKTFCGPSAPNGFGAWCWTEMVPVDVSQNEQAERFWIGFTIGMILASPFILYNGYHLIKYALEETRK